MGYVWMYMYLLMFVGLMSYVLNYTHLLNNLLSLEFMGLGLYITMNMYFFCFEGFMIFSVFFLVMLVIESVLGLSLLVCMCYSQGSDNMMSFYNCLC